VFKCATLSGSAARSSSFFCGGGRHVEKLLRGRGLLCLLSIVGALSGGPPLLSLLVHRTFFREESPSYSGIYDVFTS